MDSILPNQERARWVVIIFYINILLTLVFAATQWWQAGFIQSDEFTVEDGMQSGLIIGGSAIGFLISLIVCAVVFIRWFRRAYANLHRLNDDTLTLSHTEGWAAGAWFVPFMNLVRPYTIMKEIWNETQSAIPGKVEREGYQPTTLIGWWWACWISYNILTNIASRMGGEATVEDIAFGLKAGAIGELLSVPAALLAVRMVQQTNVFEQELYDSHRLSDPSEHLLV